MSHVVCLTCSPARPILDAGLVGSVAAHIPGAGEPRWLRAGIAAEIPAPGADAAALGGALRGAIAPLPVDVNVVSEAGRRKRLILADMDSTMIEQECIDELADFVGLKGKVAEITERAMRGEIAFEPALRERVALLAGLPVTVVDEIVAQRIRIMSGARELIHGMKAAGAYACLVSGGFTLFTGPIGTLIGFDEHRANRLLVADGHFTGSVEEPILGREAKRTTLIELRDRLGLTRDETLAVGDGANDLAMIGEAGLGVAYRAKPAVADAAAARIDHGDLTALLHLQGHTSSN
jgi:phosphoserine phosphatase